MEPSVLTSALTSALTSTVNTALLARQRTLPLSAPLRELLGQPGLVRGQVLACTGEAAPALAVAAASEANRSGAWIAVVDLPWFGVEAAAQLGVALERLVRVDTAEPRRWADTVAALADGFEIIVTRPPRLSGGHLRRVRSRLQARGVVLLALDDASASNGLAPDVVLTGSRSHWLQVADDAGHLAARRLHVTVTGRRVPNPRRGELWLPAPDAPIAFVSEVTPRAHAERDDRAVARLSAVG